MQNLNRHMKAFFAWQEHHQLSSVAIALYYTLLNLAGRCGKTTFSVYTEKGLSLGFSLTEVPELKKASRGVKAIVLDEQDCVVYGNCVPIDTEFFTYRGKNYSVKKIRNRKRGEKGQKTML